MRLIIYLFFLTFFFGKLSCQNLPQGVITKIAFGSCNLQWSRQRMWNYVIQNKPQLWIWLGDIVYADKSKNAEELTNEYNKQK